ncbi:MAG: phosphate acetyltransferase [Candidatus Eremiobacterota bacterium]
MSFMDTCRDRVRGRGLKIVYPEGLEERAVRAAAQLRAEDLAAPVLLGPQAAIREKAASLGVALEGVELRDPCEDPGREGFARTYLDLRKHKGMTPELAAERARLPHFFGALLVQAGEAHGMVSGLNSETKPFLPAFEVVKMRPGFRRASSVFLMVWPDRAWFYADCSVNIDPDPPTLCEIARATAATARSFGHEPRVAFLSFSTRDSARHPMVDHVKAAVRLTREAEPDLCVDGEMQFDAAILPQVAAKKCPGSPVAGQANVFIFPDIDAGNIAYKITERLGGAAAVGPIMQGLNRPVNDVSRGCSVQDLVDVAVVTAVQGL